MYKKLFLVLSFIILFTRYSVAFNFKVECNNDIASEPKIAAYFQKYIGRWSGEWKKDENFNFYPVRIQKIAERFHYGENFRIEVLSIKGCDIVFKVYYDQRKEDSTTYKTKVMTEEGLYIYWNSPTFDGTYILEYDVKRDVLDGIFQLFEGQNIATIKMKRL